MKDLKTRDSVIVYFGKSRLPGIIIGEYEREVFPDIYWIQLEDLSFIDAHRFQIRKVKEPETFFIARYQTNETILPNGLSLPKMTLEEASKRPEAKEILEVQVIKRHMINAPQLPEFLKKSIDPEKKDE